MQFFYGAVRAVNSADQDVVQMDNEVEKTDGQEGGQGDVEGDGAAAESGDGRTKLYVWLDCAKAVSDLTKYDFTRTFAMPIVEFLTYIAYINMDIRRQENKMRQINKKYGH